MRELSLETCQFATGGYLNGESDPLADSAQGTDEDYTLFSSGTTSNGFQYQVWGWESTGEGYIDDSGATTIGSSSGGFSSGSFAFGDTWSSINNWFGEHVDPHSDWMFDYNGDGDSMDELGFILNGTGALLMFSGVAPLGLVFIGAGWAVRISDWNNNGDYS